MTDLAAVTQPVNTARGLPNQFYVDQGVKKVSFKSPPSASTLVKVLARISEPGHEMKICYEATYLGYSLQRDLEKAGYGCEVIGRLLPCCTER